MLVELEVVISLFETVALGIMYCRPFKESNVLYDEVLAKLSDLKVGSCSEKDPWCDTLAGTSLWSKDIDVIELCLGSIEVPFGPFKLAPLCAPLGVPFACVPLALLLLLLLLLLL